MATTEPKHEHREDEQEEAAGADDEDTGAQVTPIIRLEEVAVSTGEENEDPIIDLKAKLYRFDKDGNQWKERGVGTVKLLKHKETGKVRLVMRQSKTLKICANHLDCKSFMEMFQEVAESQKKEENENGSTAAALLEKLSVEDKKSEEKSEEKTKEVDGKEEKAEDKTKEVDGKEKKAEDNDAEKKDESASA
ncbi:unnamed protein product [Withania somnifera]